MDHGLELIIPILEILEIEVSNILYNPGNIVKLIFYFLLSCKYWTSQFFQLSTILEILDRTIHTQFYPGNSGSYDPYISPILEILDRTIHYFQDRTDYGSYDPIFPGCEEVEKVCFPIFPG